MFCVFDIEKENSSKVRGKPNLEESQKLIAMSKVRNFADIAPNIGFSEFY